jgi:hypothetical protein
MKLQPVNFDFFDENWSHLEKCAPVLSDDTPKELGYGNRGYQIEQYLWSEGKGRTITTSPTGSGKSLMQVINAAREIKESDYGQRQVFGVPQLNIGRGFSKHKKIVVDGEIYDFEIEADCCVDSENPVQKIKKFLLGRVRVNECRKNKVIGGCTAVVSYASLLSAFNSMTEAEKKRVIKRTTFRFDEVHHILGVEEGCANERNRLGELCKFLLDNGAKVHLTTATFFRGDRGVILGKKYMDQFETFRVPFLVYFEALCLRSFHNEFVSYKDAEHLKKEILSSVKSEKENRAIIIVPSKGHGFFKDTNKNVWTKSLVKELKTIYGSGQVLDLVSPETQAKDKKRLISEDQDFSVIVTCAIGREGTDWPMCSRVYNTVLDKNVLQPVQKMGRALRPHDGKKDAKMINYVRHFDGWDAKPETIRQCLSDRFNAIVVASILDDMFHQILMPTIPQGKSGKKQVSLEDVYGEKRHDLVIDLVKQVAAIPEDSQSGESIDKVIDKIIEKFKGEMMEEVSHSEIKIRLRKEVARRYSPKDPSLRIKGVKVDFVRKEGWDKVVKSKIVSRSLFNGEANLKEMKSLRDFFEKENRLILDEVIAVTNELGINYFTEKKYNANHPKVDKYEKIRKYLLNYRREYIKEGYCNVG